MKALVTGGTGFAGGYLCRHLQSFGYTVAAAGKGAPAFQPPLAALQVPMLPLDITDRAAVAATVKKLRPDFIFHLAAKTFIPDCFADVPDTFHVNASGTQTILEVMRGVDWSPRLVFVSSSAVYGKAGVSPIREDVEPRPDNPYATSKRVAELMIDQYVRQYGVDAVIVRPFSHVGAGQESRYVVGAFASQIAEIDARRRDPELVVGNLTAIRDFSDVRDIVDGYKLAAEKGKRGEIYNLASGQGRAIKDILNILRGFTTRTTAVRGDKKLFRPSDVPEFVGDAGKARLELGWTPTHRLEDTLREIYRFYRDALEAPRAT